MDELVQPPPRPVQLSKQRWLALLTFTLLNMLNCADRYVPSACKDLIKEDLGLSDFQTSTLITAFMVSFIAFTPVVAILADRGISRKAVVIVSVLLWCVSSACGSMAVDYWTLLLPRVFVGIGEAGYGTLAQTILSDYFPPEQRALVLGVYDAAMPIGVALGFLGGGFIGQYMGWRYAFLITAIPGVMVVLMAFVRMPEPGESERGNADAPKQATILATLKLVATSPQFIFSVAGNILFSFAKGVMGDWGPTFLARKHGYTTSVAASVAATVGIVGGLTGGISGGIIVKLTNSFNPHLLVSGVAVLLSSGFAALFIYALQDNRPFVIGMLMCSSYFSWFSNGPIMSSIVESAPPEMRARVIGISLVLAHLLGDAISPSITGLMSDATGNMRVAMAPYAEALKLAGMIWLVGFVFLKTCCRKKNKYQTLSEESLPLTKQTA